MFHGVTIDGSTSFAPRESDTVDEDEEEEVAEDPDVQTLVSITSQKRASSTSTTGSSSRKLTKSPVVRSMNKFMSENARIQAERNVMMQKHLDAKQQMAQQKEIARHQKIRYVQQLVRECGVEETDRKLVYAVHKITKDDDSMEFFIGTSTPTGRPGFIEYFAGVNN